MTPVHYHQGKFPPKDLVWERLIPYIGPANAALARFDGLLSAVPNAHVLLSPLTTQEAVLSSKIEGTVVTMGEVLEIEAGRESLAFTKEKREEAEEVLNYRRAIRACIDELKTRQLSLHMLRGAHALLMAGVRGSANSPGSYRTVQNWIGPPGSPIEKSSFVPIGPELVLTALNDWERYLNSTEPDILVQLAILHVEFEAIHPFEDGNGRLGRMLIPLFLFQKGLLASPDFYMSGYMESNRSEYQERLRAVSRDDDWTGWCEFFLEGVRSQANDNENKARSILKSYESVKKQIIDLTRSQYAIHSVDFIFQNPIFSGSLFMDFSNIPRPTAARILRQLRDNEILQTVIEGRGNRPGIYAFKELIDIAEGRISF